MSNKDTTTSPATTRVWGHRENRLRQYPTSIASRVFPALPLQQLHSKPSQQNYDDLIGAVTKSASKRAEMMLLDIFIVALEYIKNVRRIGGVGWSALSKVHPGDKRGSNMSSTGG